MNEEKKKIFIGFDFSINKPAMTIVKDNEIKFFIWPLELSKNEEKVYSKSDVFWYNRNLEKISKKSKFNTTQMVFEHTKRSTELADKIIFDIQDYIGNISDYDIYMSSEGLSFASDGNSSLDLATYKGVLLSKLYQNITENIYTYAPISIKKVAGHSSKSEMESKNPMIDAFVQEPIQSVIKDMIKNGETIAKTNHIHCIDDIADSYWCCKTMYKREKLSGFALWDN